MIPKKIFQTHKTIEHINNNPKLVLGTNSWKQLAPDYEYHFYNNDDCDNFMKTNYCGPVYKAYKKSPFRVMKADLWRYCIIHHFGGIYADSDTRLLTNPSIFHKDDALLVGVPENSVHLCQWIYSAPKGSPILGCIIENIAELFHNIDDFNHPHIVHMLTGPGAFTQGIEKYLKNKNLPIFQNKCDYVNYPDKRLFIYPDIEFHDVKVLHMFSGYWDGGWARERDEYMKKHLV